MTLSYINHMESVGAYTPEYAEMCREKSQEKAYCNICSKDITDGKRDIDWTFNKNKSHYAICKGCDNK